MRAKSQIGRKLGMAVKVDDATYDHLRRLAVAEDRTINAVLRRAVKAYSGTSGPQRPTRPR